MRSDSYFSKLTDEQREDVRALCLQPGLSLAALRKAVPDWPGRSRKPSTVALGKLRKQIRAEDTLNNIKATALVMEKIHKQLEGQADDEVLQACLSLLGQEVLQQTLEKDDPVTRRHSLRILLKREDQKLKERNLTLLEKQAALAEEAEETLNNSTLTEEEKAAKMRALFGR